LKLRQFIPVLIIAAGIWAYHNSLQGPFIFDDHSSVEDNLTIRHLWPIGDALSPPAKSFVGGRPMVNFSLALNYAWGGLAVWGYHAFNLAVHVLAGLTLYGIVRRTLLRPGLQERFGGASGGWVALAVAVLWTVHPLQTEAVTYISQRCESLMGLFYLLSLYGFLRGAESRRSVWWFSLSVAACYLGVASKEVMVTAPLMVLLYDRTFVSGSFREAWARHWRLYLGLASSWLWLGYLMTGLNRAVGYGLGITWWGYALTQCRAVVQYLQLALWPHPLILDYGRYVPTGPLAAVAPYALILAVLATGVLFELKRQPAIGFVGAWFFVILAPTSSVVPIGGSPMAEHRMYLPLAAVVTLTVIGAFEIGKRLFHKQQGIVLGCVAGGFVAVLLTFRTIQRNRDYDSALTIWQDTVEKCPNNPRAHNGLGLALMQTGKVREAIGQYEQALRLKPDSAEAHNNLGIALEQAGRAQEATEQYEQALRINPDYPDARNNLGIALMGQGRLQEAIGHYEQALRIKPDYVQAQCSWGNALLQAGRAQEAIGHYEQALRLKPDYAEAHYNLGLGLVQVGRRQEAIGHYEQALRLKPDYAEAHYNLGLGLVQVGRLQEAMEHWEQAVRIRPDYAEAHYNLGLGLVQVGRLQEAMEHWEQAVRIRPDYADAYYNLGVALEKLGRTPEAIEHYERALRIKPDFVQAQSRLARARAVQ
jgi:tetratricopeptide (TPR) repeat protein